MVLRERTLVFDFPGKRGNSVPAVHLHRLDELSNGWDVRPKLNSRFSRVFRDTDDIVTTPKVYDRDFLRDVNHKVYFSSVHPPSPIVLDSALSAPLVETTSSTYSTPFLSGAYDHISRSRVPLRYDCSPSIRTLPSYQYPRSYSTDSRRRSWVSGIRPVIRRRTAMDEEVEAFLASTPQNRYTSYTPSFRSRSIPSVSHYNSIYSNNGTPSYAAQHLYRPPTWTQNSSGWTSHSFPEHSGQSGYLPFYMLSTRAVPPLTSPVSPAYAPFVTSMARSMTNYIPKPHARSQSVAGRPLSVAGSSYNRSTPAVCPTVSTDRTYISKPPCFTKIPSYGLTRKSQGEDGHISPSNLRSGRSRSRFSEAINSSQFDRKPRSASVAGDAPRLLANYKDVKPPMSDTRRRVRDLICKTRKDPHYYN